MVTISLLAIELKATPNGNPTNDFNWRRKSSSLNVVQCNTTSRSIVFHRHNLYIAQPEIFKQPDYVFWNTAQEFLSYNPNVIFDHFFI